MSVYVLSRNMVGVALKVVDSNMSSVSLSRQDWMSAAHVTANHW